MELSFPSDEEGAKQYPFYDRWLDGFNLCQEFVILNQARSLGYLSWLMAQTSLKTQPWKSATAQIRGLPANGKSGGTLSLEAAANLDLSTARIVWEVEGQPSTLGKTRAVEPGRFTWVEAEAQLVDGRRVFGVTNLPALH
jgi:hypothetical protein